MYNTFKNLIEEHDNKYNYEKTNNLELVQSEFQEQMLDASTKRKQDDVTIR